MFVLTINDRVGTAAGFSGVRAFIGCEDQAKLIAVIKEGRAQLEEQMALERAERKSQPRT